MSHDQAPSPADRNEARRSAHAASSQADAEPPDAETSAPDPSDSGADAGAAPDGAEIVPSPS